MRPIGRQGAGEVEGFAGGGMGEDDAGSVEPVAGGFERRAIQRIAGDGVSGGGEMAADLVGDAAEDDDVEQ